MILGLLCVLLLSTVAKSATVSITTNSSLQYYLCHRGHLESHTTLVLSPTVSHILSPAPFCLVSNLTNITLHSQYKHAVITCSSDNITSTTVGFGFYNVSELSLINIDIRGCGGVMPSQDSAIYTNDSAFYFPQGQSATLIISKCSNITLTNVSITEYYGYAIVFINPNGSTSVYNITIMDALGIQICYIYMYDNPPLNCSGSGVVLYYYHDAELSLKSKVVIDTGLLKRNWMYIDSSLLGELDGNTRRPISSFASALTIIFSKGNYEAHALLKNVQLFKLNLWPIVPKMALIFYNAPVQKCHIDIIECKFSHHEIEHFMDVQFYFETQEPRALDLCCEWNAVSFYHCLFHDTFVIDVARFRLHNSSSSNTFIKLSMNSKLSHNISVLFDHVYYDSHILQEPPFIVAYGDFNQLFTKSLTIVLNNFCMSNIDKIVNPTATYNARLIFINIASVVITGNNNLFEHQPDSIIEAYNTDIHLKGTAIFRYNSATNGAAIQLSWPSRLHIYESTNATFLDNKVSFYGGAIYSYTEQNLIFNKNTLCAIQIVTNKTDVSQIGVLMKFINNTADRSGNSIYASPLYNCKQLYTNVNNKHLYAKVFEISSKFDFPNEISSVPVSAVLCNIHGILTIYPGFTSTLRLKATDLSGTVTYANIEARIHSTVKHKTSFFNWLPQQQRIQTVTGNGCTELHYTLYPEGDVDYVTLHFSVVGNTFSSSINIQILPCPPGFYYNTLHHSCTCSPYLIRYNIRHCDIDTTSITVSPQSWLGVIPNSTLAYAHHCPSGYCTNSQTVNVTRPHHMCSGNRKGTLCGECVQGYSVIVGSNTCHTCSDKSWYIVLVYLVGSVVYVFLLYLLRLTIDEGTLGGLVFWLDLTDVTSTLKTDNSYIRYLVSVMYLVKYKWKFPNLCYYNGLNMLGKSAIAFAQPLVLWTLVGVIVLVSRYSQKVSNMTVGSSVQVLATLMYISFSELLINSVIVLTPEHVYYVDNSSTSLLVWYADGSVLFCRNVYHIVLVCVSIVVLLLFIVPYTVIGVLGRKLTRYRCVAKYMRPFIEALQGPYKDNRKYWFGVRLLVQITVYIIHSVLQDSSSTIKPLIYVFILVTFISLQIQLSPYKKWVMNMLDLWMMLLLLCYFIMSLYYSSKADSVGSNRTSTVLGALVLITLLAIVTYHVCMKMKQARCCRKCFSGRLTLTKLKCLQLDEDTSEDDVPLRDDF